MRRLFYALALLLAAPVVAQPALSFDPDTVQARPLDGGKMWLFEDPPTEYLAETYGFRPGDEWFERARLASLRMPGCSASFVSPTGLVLTNHHCAQGSVVSVDRGGEGLLDNGFMAMEQSEERRVPDLYMDQLVAIEDVTDAMSAAVDAAETDAEREAAFDQAQADVTARLLRPYGITAPDADTDDYVVQVVGLYNGGRYSAYVFRRYRDIRLVMAPERALGYFGGDYDNFTYPRYAADFAFFRIYGDDGQPVESPAYFPLAADGVEEGTVVFVIGNPGSTARGLTVAELEFVRDVTLPTTLAFINSRAAALQAYLDSGEAPEPDVVRSQLFSLLNAQKATGGRLRGLSDPYIIARRAAAERAFRAASPAAAALIDEQAALQAQKRELAAAYRAFPYLFNTRYGSALMRRALARASGNEAEVEPLPDAVERGFLTAEVEALRGYYSETGRPLPDALAGATAEEAARRLLDAPDGESQAVALVQEIQPALAEYRSAASGLSAQERDVARRLGRERFATYGNAVPPDATFSLRFTDGIVTGYPYNGTIAPPMTTLYGMYDRYHSFCTSGRETTGACDWALPERWIEAQSRLDLSTPVNFTSTSDTIGGNSGSPVVNRDLQLVGLNFDRTIEGLVRDYIYAPERGRNVMVDTRLVMEALRSVYGLDGLVAELTRAARP